MFYPMKFIYSSFFLFTGHISALAGRIFVILVSFDWVSLQFLDSIQISDRSDPYILHCVKMRKIFRPQSRLDGDHSKIAEFFGMPKQTGSVQMIGLSCPEIWLVNFGEV